MNWQLILGINFWLPQWEYKEEDKENLVMTSADLSLVYDFYNKTYVDSYGNEGVVGCGIVKDSSYEPAYDTHKRNLEGGYCPISKTYDKVVEYCEDERQWLRDFFKAMDKMLKNGY